MKTAITKYSLIAGLLVSIFFLGPILVAPEGYMDPEKMDSGAVIGYSVMVLSMLTIFFGVRAYRNQNSPDDFSFGKALWVGVQITIFANLIFYIANVMIYEVLAPGFLQEFGVAYKDYLIESAADEASRQAAVEQFEAEAGLLENSYLYALVMAGTTFFIGIIISLISALVLKRNKSLTV